MCQLLLKPFLILTWHNAMYQSLERVEYDLKFCHFKRWRGWPRERPCGEDEHSGSGEARQLPVESHHFPSAVCLFLISQFITLLSLFKSLVSWHLWTRVWNEREWNRNRGEQGWQGNCLIWNGLAEFLLGSLWNEEGAGMKREGGIQSSWWEVEAHGTQFKLLYM